MDIGPGFGLKTLSTGEERASEFKTEAKEEYLATENKLVTGEQLLCPTRNVLEQWPQITRMPVGWC